MMLLLQIFNILRSEFMRFKLRAGFLLLFLLFLSPLLAREHNNKLFEQANNYYLQKDYHAAIEIYNELIKEGYDNFQVNYNLALAYYALQKPGFTIYHLEQSQIYAPFSKKQNQLFASIEKDFNIDLKREFQFIEQIVFFFTPTILFLTYLSLFILMSMLFFLFLKKKRKIFKYFLGVLGIVSFFMALIMSIQFFYTIKPSCIIVAEGGTDLLLSDKLPTVLSTINEGSRCTLIEKSGDYYQIKYDDNMFGFIKKEDAKLIKY